MHLTYTLKLLYAHSVIQVTNFRKVNKIIFFMNCWDLVWLLDSGAQEERTFPNVSLFLFLQEVKFVILHQQGPWQCM